MLASERRALLKNSNKPVNIKYHNQKLILSLLRKADTLSIAELSKKAKLSKTTIAKVIGEFMAKGLVLNAGKGESTDVGGKKPEMFSFNASFSHVAALAVRKDEMLGAITDLRGKPLCHREMPCGPRVAYEAALGQMAGMFHNLLADSGLSPNNLFGIVLGCEGVVDVERNLVRYTLQHDWGRNLDIAADLQAHIRLPIPIRMDNNVRLSGYAYLEAEQYGVMVVISSGRSTGGCVVEARELIHGDNGFVGELGHVIVEPSSKIRCRCGTRGCFEAMVSPDLILAEARKQAGRHPDSPFRRRTLEKKFAIGDVFSAADAGDAFARLLLDKVINYFVILIHNIVLLRDPGKIIIQGLYAEAGDYFFASIRERLRSLPFYKTPHAPPIIRAAMGPEDPLLLGAARFGADEFLRGNHLYD
ncbi:MAG: ROK family transcriptional regulator [Planctomycetota bacterium]|jgi:predicted NBD/HSP70 family sugar kinase|nr:ROK family transcriptional regulator [Planctomycetota bacterium]